MGTTDKTQPSECADGRMPAPGAAEGKLIVLTAPLTEIIDHAGFFIQMSMASMPVWMEGVLNKKYPKWRDLERNEDGSARVMPAGIRILEESLRLSFPAEDIVSCYPEDLPRFVGPRTRAVGISTHNPLGVTFAAGVYTSVFGTSKNPINSHYARQLFLGLRDNPWRRNFKVIVGGSGAWQIAQTQSQQELSVDCVLEGRSEARETRDLFRKAIGGEDLPAHIDVAHPQEKEEILVPTGRTTFGVVEMTTGCGRRCRFCMPDLSPQLDLPRESIMAAVQANVAQGNKQISLATEDMFIWGQVRTGTPFFFPNREALLELYAEIARTPGVEQILLSHSTMAPAVVDPVLIEKLTTVLLPKSPVHLPRISTHPSRKILSPLIGLETGSVAQARELMPGKSAPFPIEEWPSVFIQGLTIMNRHHWFPVVTLIIGSPGETEEDTKATLDLVYETERRKLFAFYVPSIFTPLQDTRMAGSEGVAETRELTALQWQLMMKCWKMNLRAAQFKWWAPLAWRAGAFGLWLFRLRKLNGPRFTWPLFLFAGALPERLMARLGKIYMGRPMTVKSRKELIALIRPGWWKHLRADAGDIPEAAGAEQSRSVA